MTGIDPAEVAAKITGCKKARGHDACYLDHGYDPNPLGWPCADLTDAAEIIRAALEQAWLEGYIAAVRQHPTIAFMGARNPYVKGGK